MATTAQEWKQPGLALRAAAAMFLLGPAAIHFAVAPEHLSEWLPYGLLFYVLAAVQIFVAGAVLMRPSSPLLLGGAALTLLVIGIWLLSRTVGIPVGPFAGQPESIGLPDLFATLMEWVAAGLLVLADFRLDSSHVWRLSRAVPGLAVAASVSVVMTLFGLAAITTAATH